MSNDDVALVHDYLASYRRTYLDASWTRNPNDTTYVAEVAARIAELRADYRGDGMFLAPTHDIDETGFCVECDARRIFMNETE